MFDVGGVGGRGPGQGTLEGGQAVPQVPERDHVEAAVEPAVQQHQPDLFQLGWLVGSGQPRGDPLGGEGAAAHALPPCLVVRGSVKTTAGSSAVVVWVMCQPSPTCPAVRTIASASAVGSRSSATATRWATATSRLPWGKLGLVRSVPCRACAQRDRSRSAM